jgi:hypothetical protein
MTERPRQLHLFARMSDTIGASDERQRWLNSPAKVYEGTLSKLRQYIPDFDRRPFAIVQENGLPSRVNERLDTIVRMPFEGDAAVIPIAVVSRNYVLVSHRDVFEATAKALGGQGIDPDEAKAELTITEYGERMRLCIYLPDDYSFDLGGSHEMTMRLECFNSVDSSVRFRTLLGWFRFLCSNGVVIGVTQSDFHRRHIGDLNLEDIAEVFKRDIAEAREERTNLNQWRKIQVPLEKAAAWVANEVRKEWGFKAATRAYHIIRSGHDVAIAGSYKEQSPLSIPVQVKRRVPGAPEKAQNALDISQVLAWLAKERNDIGEQFDWRQQIPDLMRALLR